MAFKPSIHNCPSRGVLTCGRDLSKRRKSRRDNVDCQAQWNKTKKRQDKEASGSDYSAVRNIGYIWSLEERSDEAFIFLDIDEIGLDAVLEQLV